MDTYAFLYITKKSSGYFRRQEKRNRVLIQELVTWEDKFKKSFWSGLTFTESQNNKNEKWTECITSRNDGLVQPFASNVHSILEKDGLCEKWWFNRILYIEFQIKTLFLKHPVYWKYTYTHIFCILLSLEVPKRIIKYNARIYTKIRIVKYMASHISTMIWVIKLLLLPNNSECPIKILTLIEFSRNQKGFFKTLVQSELALMWVENTRIMDNIARL